MKQKRLSNIEEAVVATIEIESYLGTAGKPLRVSAVSPQEPGPDVHVSRADRPEAVAAVSPQEEGSSTQTVQSLSERLQRLEILKEREVPQGVGQVSKPGRPRVRNEGLWSVGLVARKDILQIFVGVAHLSNIRKTSIPQWKEPAT